MSTRVSLKGCRLFPSPVEQRQEHDPEVPSRTTSSNSYLSGCSKYKRQKLKPEHFQSQFYSRNNSSWGKLSWQNQDASIKKRYEEKEGETPAPAAAAGRQPPPPQQQGSRGAVAAGEAVTALQGLASMSACLPPAPVPHWQKLQL